MRKIPVFVSCPTALSPEQELKRKVIIDLLDDLQMEPRALGRSEYPKDTPLREVYVIAKHCAGGIILGFEQIYVESAIRKRGTPDEKKIASPIYIPTAWNNLEAGILFGLKLPLLIFREDGVEGGILDVGTSEVYIHKMPPAKPDKRKKEELWQVLLKWNSEVSTRYYEY